MFRKSLSLLMLLGAPVLFGACSDDEEPKPAPAALIIDRETLDFGDVEVGRSSGEQLFTVRNASPSAVEAVAMSIDGLGFVITSNTCEKYLDAGKECEVRVKFAPRLPGTFSAHLRVDGAPSVDATELKGTAFSWVEVTSLPPGARVAAGDDSFTCTQPCRQLVRTTDVTLYAGPEGFPTWSGDCATAPRGGCLLHMDGAKSVALQVLAPFYQWEVRLSGPPMTVATTPNGDVLVQDVNSLMRLSITGQVLWTLNVGGAMKVAVDSFGNTYVLRSDGSVSRLAADGQTVWTYTPQGELPYGYHLVVGADGDIFVLLGLGRYDTARWLKLVRLSPQGSERWNAILTEGQLNFAGGLGVDAQGQAYVSGSAYNQGATPQDPVFVKSFFRKFTSAGAMLWNKDESWYGFAVNASGEVVATSSIGAPPGGFWLWWIGADGVMQWSVQTPTGKGPGMVDTQGFAPNGTLLLGGHETVAGNDDGTTGRGWFAVLNPQTRAPGPVTYVAAPAEVRSLSLGPTGHVVVSGALGNTSGASQGFVRLYDPRVLTTEK